MESLLHVHNHFWPFQWFGPEQALELYIPAWSNCRDQLLSTCHLDVTSCFTIHRPHRLTYMLFMFRDNRFGLSRWLLGVRRCKNPDWVGCLEVQRGSRRVDHLSCRWFAAAFISFTLATAPSLCGWRLIARQHMVPLASDHSTTCLSNCTSLPPTLPPQLRRMHFDRP